MSERATYTPGPWKYRGLAGDHDFEVYAEGGNGRGLALVRDFHEGNARLIAAAPELLQVVQWALARLVSVSDFSDEQSEASQLQRALRALLARVQGEG